MNLLSVSRFFAHFFRGNHDKFSFLVETITPASTSTHRLHVSGKTVQFGHLILFKALFQLPFGTRHGCCTLDSDLLKLKWLLKL